MEYGHDVTRPRTRVSPHPTGPPRVPLGQRVVAALGVALCLAVGTATVTAVLAEAHAPAGPGPEAGTPAAPLGPDPAALRVWGLRLTPQGTLAPAAAGDPVARTALELYADLLTPPRR